VYSYTSTRIGVINATTSAKVEQVSGRPATAGHKELCPTRSFC
jgi:hypothetical protein